MVGVLSNFSPPAEGILLEVPSTKLMVDNEEVGTGTLYIRETDVIWGGGHKPTGGSAPNITILYPNISIHAVQKDPALALYMVVNYDMKDILKLDNAGGDEMEENDDEYEDETPITQLRFIPEKEGELQEMYAAMCQGQALNPDPADEVDEDQFFMGEEDDDDQFADAEVSHPDDGSRLAQQAQHLTLEQNNENGYNEDDQNED